MIVSADAEQLGRLAEAAFARAASLPARSPERRCAAHLWIALTVPPARSVTAARRAVESFGDKQTQSDALDLMHRLAAQTTSPPTHITTTEDQT